MLELSYRFQTVGYILESEELYNHNQSVSMCILSITIFGLFCLIGLGMLEFSFQFQTLYDDS